MFTGGLHSSETGPPEMLMELAYRLAAEESPLFDQIRKNVIVMMTAAAEPDGRDRYVDWYYHYMISAGKRAGPHSRPALLGQVHLPRQQSRHQLLAGDHAQLAEVLPEWHPPIMHDLHESRAVACTPSAGRRRRTPRSTPFLRRAALVLQFRNDQDDRLRHARRVDPRFRGYVVAGLSGLHVVQSQRHAAHVRDLRQRRRQHHEAHHRRRRRRRGGGRGRRGAEAAGAV